MKNEPIFCCSSAFGVLTNKLPTCSRERLGCAPTVGLRRIYSFTTFPANDVIRKLVSKSYPLIIARAWLVLAGNIDLFTIAVLPNVPAIENRISFSSNRDLFK